MEVDSGKDKTYERDREREEHSISISDRKDEKEETNRYNIIQSKRNEQTNERANEHQLSSITSHAPLLLILLLLLLAISSPQPTRQSDGAKHTLGRLDGDIALASLRRRALFLVVVAAVVVRFAMFRAAAVVAFPVFVIAAAAAAAATAVLAAGGRGANGADAVFWEDGLGV